MQEIESVEITDQSFKTATNAAKALGVDLSVIIDMALDDFKHTSLNMLTYKEEIYRRHRKAGKLT